MILNQERADRAMVCVLLVGVTTEEGMRPPYGSCRVSFSSSSIGRWWFHTKKHA